MATKADDAHKHALQLMGKLIPYGTKRDAVHIAVAPVVSDDAMPLEPGERIKFSSLLGGNELVISANGGKCVGIVDPYLPHSVKRGDRFFMYLFPMTTNSLRHEWTHPDFGEEPAQSGDVFTKEKSKSWILAWLATQESRSDYLDYDMLLSFADEDYACVYGSDFGAEVPDELWDHVQNVTGRKVKNRHTFISCSC